MSISPFETSPPLSVSEFNLLTKDSRSYSLVGNLVIPKNFDSPRRVKRVSSDPTLDIEKFKVDLQRTSTLESFKPRQLPNQLEILDAKMEVFERAIETLKDKGCGLRLQYRASGSFIEPYKLNESKELDKSGSFEKIAVLFKSFLQELEELSSFPLLVRWGAILEKVENSYWLTTQKDPKGAFPRWFLDLKCESQKVLDKSVASLGLQRAYKAIGEENLPLINSLKKISTLLASCHYDLLLSAKKEISSALSTAEQRRSLITEERLKKYLLGTFREYTYDHIIEENIGWTFTPDDFVIPFELALTESLKGTKAHEHLLLKSIVLARNFHKIDEQDGDVSFLKPHPKLVPFFDYLISISDSFPTLKSLLLLEMNLKTISHRPKEITLPSASKIQKIEIVKQGNYKAILKKVVDDLLLYYIEMTLAINPREFKFAGKDEKIQRKYAPNIYRRVEFSNAISRFVLNFEFQSEKVRQKFFLNLIKMVVESGNFGAAFDLFASTSQRGFEWKLPDNKKYNDLKNEINELFNFSFNFKKLRETMARKEESGFLVIPDMISLKKDFVILTEEVPSKEGNMVNGAKMEKIVELLEKFKEMQGKMNAITSKPKELQTDIIQTVLSKYDRRT